MIRRGTGDLVADQAIHGCDIDDASVLRRDHRFLRSCAGNAEGTEQINIHLISKLLVRNILGRSHSARTGVVDQDINSSELLQYGIDHVFHRRCVRDVAADRKRLHAEFIRDLLRDSVDHVLAAGNGYNRGTLIGQRLGHLHAKSGRAARHNRNLTLQIKIILHLIPPVRCDNNGI